jgi:heme A synthase
MTEILAGMVTMGFLIAALFFVRFWRRTGDPLFATFAVAFVLLAVNQALIGVSNVPNEGHSWLYLPRLAAFALLIAAIVWKNMDNARSSKR